MNQTGTDSEVQRRLELLASKALGDLTAEEQLDVDALLQEQRWQSALWQLEATAAAVDLRLRPEQRSAMPTRLAQAIREDASAYFDRVKALDIPTVFTPVPRPTQCPPESNGNESASSESSGNEAGCLKVPASSAERSQPLAQPSSGEIALPQVMPTQAKSSSSSREWLGWFACAASLLLALGLWNASRPTAATEISAASERATLLASAQDIVQIEWAAGPTPFSEKVVGDVVWSNERQQGYMRFRGMPVNDPQVQQYQLWIIDPLRDEQPIDGGVFDISADGEVIVPIDAKLKVNAAKAFAITIEQPGGVVVSDQSRLPLLAAVE